MSIAENIVTIRTRPERQHIQPVLQPFYCFRTGYCFKNRGPVISPVEPEPVDPGHRYANGILRSAYFLCPRIVVVPEKRFCKLLGLLERQMVVPQLYGFFTGRGGHPRAFVKFNRRFERGGYCRSRMMDRDIRLIDPGTCNVDPVRYGLNRPQCRCRPGRKAGVGYPFQDLVFNSQFPAELLLFGCVAVLVNDEDLRRQLLHVLHKIEKPASPVDNNPVDAFQGAQDVHPFLFGVNCIAAFQLPDGPVRSQTYIQITIPGGFLQKCNMPGMHHVETTRHEDFFIICAH